MVKILAINHDCFEIILLAIEHLLILLQAYCELQNFLRL